jgi:thiol-disulfide isomerase/thioredoxin
MVLLALDERTAAFEGLVQASIAAEGAPSDVVYAALEATYLDGGVWHPDGLDGYLDYRLSLDSLDDDDDGEEGHALLGEPFPFTAYTDLRGREQPLEVGGSILVVDFWATWCGPCIYGMPHLQAVTDAYADRGVRVIGLSVDDELAPVKALFAGDFQPAYTVGWVGLSGFESGKFRGIPSLFVVDEQGRVNTYIAGYSDGDIRLEKALDALLEESP